MKQCSWIGVVTIPWFFSAPRGRRKTGRRKMRPTLKAEEKLEAARALRDLVLRHRESIDADRRLPEPILQAMAAIGIFRSMVPASAGGEEWDWPTWLRVVEELSTVDGAVGWIAGVGGSVNAIFTGWVSDDVGRVLCADPIASIAGAGMPSGTARRTEGGYVLSGRWQFGSSSPHACWFVAGYALEGETPHLGPNMFFPAKDVEIIDTWSVGGMRGTGSHDFAVRDLFVPADYALNAVDDPPLHPGPLYRLPVTLTLASGLAPLALGIARGALDSFIDLMETRVDRYRFSGAAMRDRLTVQERVAKAEALARSGRAFLYETAAGLWDAVSSEGRLSEKQHALGRLALMHAVASGAQAVDLVYHAAGTASIFTKSLLERFFRDVHVATQHRFASPEEMYQVGAVLLGANPS
jgi:alkylation response protein AidB-like acyl-CoA dehydrogenase